MDSELDGGAGGVRAMIRIRLRAAMRAHDTTATSALRSVSAAIANAEAVRPAEAAATHPSAGSAHVAGAVGVGATDVPRRELSEADVVVIITTEAEQREDAAQTYEASGHPERAAGLRQQAQVIRGLLDPS